MRVSEPLAALWVLGHWASAIRSDDVWLLGFEGATARPSLLEDVGKQKDSMFVDAGSSGSKVFVFTPAKTSAKFLTTCAKSKPLQGLSALGYSKAECEWKCGDKPLGDATKYAPMLLDLVASTYKKASGKTDFNNVVGSQAVPMLATAGMRLVNQGTNDKIWGLVCGKAGSGLKFAPRGEKCGTIPGTTEAYYEFLANAAHGQSKVLTGTFCIGGASAQISIPLKTDKDVAAFKQMKSKVQQELKCSALKLADGQQAPVFSTSKKCIDDYIAYKPVSAIKATQTVLNTNIGAKQIKGVGLISFLGLRGKGTFVAGGVNEIETWAKDAKCDGKTGSFADCSKKLQDALAKDIMWSNVKEYFSNNALDIDHFSYNTNAAVPEKAGLKASGKEQGWQLKTLLSTTCKDTGFAKKIGFGNSNTCMKAFYTALYVTSFFAQKKLAKQAMTGEPWFHNSNNLIFDPNRDWAEGLKEQINGTALLLEKSDDADDDKEVDSLLRVPVHRHTTNYIDGFQIHASGLGL